MHVTSNTISQLMTNYVRVTTDNADVKKIILTYNDHFQTIELQQQDNLENIVFIPLNASQVAFLRSLNPDNVALQSTLADLQTLATNMVAYPREQQLFSPLRFGLLFQVIRQQIQTPNAEQAEYIRQVGLRDIYPIRFMTYCVSSTPPLPDPETLQKVTDYFTPPCFYKAETFIYALLDCATASGKYSEGQKRFALPNLFVNPMRSALQQNPRVEETLYQIVNILEKQQGTIRCLRELVKQAIAQLKDPKESQIFVLTIEGVDPHRGANELMTTYFKEAIETHGTQERKNTYRGVNLDYDPLFQLFRLHCTNGDTWYRPLKTEEMLLLDGISTMGPAIPEETAQKLKQIAVRMATFPVKYSVLIPINWSLKKLQCFKKQLEQNPTPVQRAFMEQIGYLDIIISPSDYRTLIQTSLVLSNIDLPKDFLSLPYERDARVIPFMDAVFDCYSKTPRYPSPVEIKTNFASAIEDPTFRELIQGVMEVSDVEGTILSHLIAEIFNS